ncbi:hypothetical protein JCM19239_972 [Vibrio variabilis]|uniref:Uncharacterized protein n=1 Tax=Vibrio variabilis TaxID=990271 RepID=A0ABQ0JL97_9VIBR|nr:hypothetical protein JCM19239_972 [Vibrio variabilis]
MAPQPTSSTGLSDVSRTSGSLVSFDSATAGNKLATAVPEVTITATGV